MKIKIIISFMFCFIVCNAFSQNEAIVDSLPSENTDSIISEIVTKKEKPNAGKIEYISRLTRYGFKNLFQKNTYSKTLPYSQQINPNAEGFMQDYLRSHGKYLTGMKSWGSSYFTLIDNILAQYGLPKELKYLAVIESHLSASATSWVGAGGPWQFMPYTAREYGLIVNGNIDERRDYYKSTHAAAKYLLQLYRQLHDWLLVIAAYNGGPGRVFSAIKNSGSRNFWSLQYNLPTESRNHVKKFIATHYIMEGTGSVVSGAIPNVAAANSGYIATPIVGAANPHSSKPILSDVEAQNVSTQTVSGKFNSVIIAKNISMDIAMFNRYNPNFDNGMTSDGQYDLILPSEKMQLFLANKYQILNECVQTMLGSNDAPSIKTVYPRKYRRRR